MSDQAVSKTVTVVMATFNGAKFVDRQLASIAAQTLAPDELIVSDDGSTDHTLEIITRFSKTVSFPVHIYQNTVRLGYADNFLHAAGKAQSRFIAFCDQDDVWDAQKLEVCVSALIKGGALLCVHAINVIDVNGMRIGRISQQISRTVIDKPDGAWNAWGYYLGMSQVFDRRLLTILPQATHINFLPGSQIRGLDPYNGSNILPHDKWIEFLARSFGHIATINEPLAQYRLHSDNASLSDHTIKRWRTQLSWAMGLPAHVMFKRPEIAQYRSNLLRDATPLIVDPQLRRRVVKAADAWDRIAAHEQRRLDMYGSRRFVTRLSRFICLIRDGCYSSKWVGGLGPGLLVKDTVVGLLRVRSVKV